MLSFKKIEEKDENELSRLCAILMEMSISLPYETGNKVN